MNMAPSGEVRAEPGTVLHFNFVVPSPVPMPTLIAASARALPGAYLVSQPFLFFTVMVPTATRTAKRQRLLLPLAVPIRALRLPVSDVAVRSIARPASMDWPDAMTAMIVSMLNESFLAEPSNILSSEICGQIPPPESALPM